MATLLLPEDVEQAFIDELSPFYTIGTTVPEEPPALFFRVLAAGGYQRDLVTDTFTVTLEAFAKGFETPARNALAMAIARVQLKQQTAGTLGNTVCYRVQIAAPPQNFPYPQLPTHRRYIATLAPDVRRQSITL